MPTRNRFISAADRAADAAIAWEKYLGELARIEARERARQEAEDALDLMEGRDTEGAERAAARINAMLARVQASRNLATVELSTSTNRERRKQNKARAKLNPQKTRTVYVASPVVEGYRERLEQVVDPVFAMYRRRQIDERCYRAAETYRSAWDVVSGRLGSTMDFDRVRAIGKAPGYSDAELCAAEVLNETEGLLGLIDRYVVELIVGCAWSVEEVTRMLLGPDPITGETTDRDRSHIGHRLRLSLKILAQRWHPHQRSKIRSHRDDDAKPMSARAGINPVPVLAFVSDAKRGA